nr:NAD(P)-binding protein [Streptomyces sp. RKAG293]
MSSTTASSRVPKRSSYDAVIVGGGHNGLVAAAYPARAGRSVLLPERLTGGARQGGRTGRRTHRRYFLGYVPRRAP